MLKKLSIANLAIIENITIEFKDGFTVLTGGTGAGKSLVIDSLSLLLGARADSELIRTGEEKATIIGYFSISNSRLEAALNSLNIPFVDNEIIIERTISKNKGNSIKINNISVTLNELNRISKHLADIHSQFDFVKILNPDNYLEIIDGFAFDLINTYKKEYQSSLEKYRLSKKDYEILLKKKEDFDKAKDFYEFQYKELKELDLKLGEEEAIASEISLLKNYDKFYSLTQEAEEIINTDFNDRLYELNKTVDKLAEIQPDYQEIKDKLSDAYYTIDDLIDTLKKKFRAIDYDPDRLDYLQSRESEINNLKRKYHKDINELIAFRDELEVMIGQNSTFNSDLESKKKECEELFQETFKKGQDLSKVRQKIALSIEKEIMNNLNLLYLKATFKISFKDIEKDDALFLEIGLDQIDFLIETNVGEGLKSLSKVVSGGEASRIMLAIKAVFIKANKVSTVIFDEIDTGISGEAAQAVAERIHNISISSQVICITHMPQIASLSDHHILIAKEVKKDRTYTSIKELDLEEKIKEVAHLISGDKITEKQLEYAREMVLSNR